MRAEAIRKNIIELSYAAKSAHVGSSLSCVEILDALFSLRTQSGKLNASTIILSKGHAAMALYAAAIEYDLLSSEHKTNYLQDGTSIWGHPSVNTKHPFIEWSTGSLGHGLPVACGMAYARKYTKKHQNVAVIISDGELNEGSNWEAILFAAQHRLDNITVIVDYNKIQSFGRCDEVINLEPLTEKFKTFNWHVEEVDGHNITDLTRELVRENSKPKIIVAHTIKGKGITEYENRLESHYKPINEELFRKYGQNINAK
jgi:transketolase